jgi:hypothetical protein
MQAKIRLHKHEVSGTLRKCVALDLRIKKEIRPMLETIIIVILVLALLGALPNWGHSRNWGYGPSGLLGTILIIVLIIYLLQRI